MNKNKNEEVYVLTDGYPSYRILGVFDNKNEPRKIKNKNRRNLSILNFEIEEFILNKFY